MRERYQNHEIISDIGSGINFKRTDLLSILERASRGNLEEVVVAHRDRLYRFAFELIQWILERNHVTLVVIANKDSTPQTELAEDLLAIIHVFLCRANGRRRYTKNAEKAETRGAKRRRSTEVEEEENGTKRFSSETQMG